MGLLFVVSAPPHPTPTPPPAGSEDTVVCRSNCYYCREDKSGPPACCGGSALTSHFHRQTNTFPRTVKFSRRRRRRRRGRHQGAGGDSQSRSIIFPNLLKKFLEKFCCPLFFIHRSIFQSIPVSLGFFFPDRGRFCVFLHST